MRVRVGSRTDVGLVRKGNEDSSVVADPLFAVADGMGGHLAGEVASATAVEVIQGRPSDLDLSDPDALKDLMREANTAIWKKAQSDPGLKGMGTTCTLLFVHDGQSYIAHVGDSRAYLLRDGEFSQLTEDHTLVERMVQEGRLSPEQAERHPQRSIITRALGVDSDVQVDILPLNVKPGDRFVLCSDGLSTMLDAAQIHDMAAAEDDPQAAADRLVDLANEAGGEDNITVLIVDVLGPGQTDAADATAAAAAPDRGPAQTTPPPPHGTAAAPAPRRRRRLAWALVVIAVLLAAGWLAVRYTLDNSWFVGVDDSGRVTIYRGIPEEIAGLDLSREEETTDIQLDDLPAFLQEDVQEGIKVTSFDEASETVANLEERSQDPDFDATGQGGG